MEERLTKKELKEKRKLEKLADMEKKQSSNGMTKWLIIGAVVFLCGVFFIGSIVMAKIANDKKFAAGPVAISNSGWVTGNPKSTVSVTEFGDLQCPACRTFEPTMQQLRKEYGSKVKIVFKHFPLKAAHPNAMDAAMAAEAAGAQGKFWEFHDMLYSLQDEWASLPDPTEKFVSYAKELKLDVDQFQKDLKNKDFEKKINDQEDEGVRIGVNATPTVYINGKYAGYPSYPELKKQIEELLAKQ